MRSVVRGFGRIVPSLVMAAAVTFLASGLLFLVAPPASSEFNGFSSAPPDVAIARGPFAIAPADTGAPSAKPSSATGPRRSAASSTAPTSGESAPPPGASTSPAVPPSSPAVPASPLPAATGAAPAATSPLPGPPSSPPGATNPPPGATNPPPVATRPPPDVSAPPSAVVPPSPRDPGAPPFGVATRVVVPALHIDLPVVPGSLDVPGNSGGYPLCDVAQYLDVYVQPGQPGTTYLYAHAREGMFLPLLLSSQRRNGAGMIGALVEVYTGAGHVYLYEIYAVKRHATDFSLADEVAAGEQRLVLQTSEGPHGTIPKLQVAARLLDDRPADPSVSTPRPNPRAC